MFIAGLNLCYTKNSIINVIFSTLSVLCILIYLVFKLISLSPTKAFIWKA